MVSLVTERIGIVLRDSIVSPSENVIMTITHGRYMLSTRGYLTGGRHASRQHTDIRIATFLLVVFAIC